MLRRLRRLLVVALLLALAAGAAGWYGWRHLQAHMATPGPLAEERVVLLERGQGLAAIAGRLEREGVIADAFLFQLGARLFGRDRRLQAGEYGFAPGASPLEVLDLLESGRVYARRLTVQEGLTVAEVWELLRAAPFLDGELPDPPPEGSLLPETYHYVRGDGRAAVAERMRTAMARTLEELWAARDPDLPLASPEEAVILASIVEKETGVAAERGRVAGVFVNRLRRGMRLQSDPTVIYAVTEGRGPLGRALTRADLDRDHPYNTYRSAGLPPGPIANPGRDSLAAALSPEAVEYLYFVADGTGGHAFARTLEQHNRNVRNWRRIQREAGERAPSP
jgi:UPF0755 protein